MVGDTDQIETVTIDSYGTIVDVSAVEDVLADIVEKPRIVSVTWRYTSLLNALVGTVLDQYQPFSDHLRDGLEYALATNDERVSPAEQTALLETYDDLAVYGDVRPGMHRLAAAGFDLYVVSNGDPGMLDSVVSSAGIGDLLEDTISAHEVQTYKPDAEIYRHAAARTGTPIRKICHVSAGQFDVAGARHAGMVDVWLNRTGGDPEPFWGEPAITCADFGAIADVLGA